MKGSNPLGWWARQISVALILVASLSTAEAQAPPSNSPPSTPTPAGLLLPAFRVEGGLLRVVVPRGSLRLRPSPDEQVRVSGRLAAGQRLRLAPTVEGMALRLLDEGRFPEAEAILLVEVPALVSLAVDVDNARLDLEAVGGDRLTVHGGGQNLRVKSPARRVVVRTLSGNLALQLTGEMLNIDSVSGAVDLDAAVSGVEVDVQSVSGDVVIRTPSPGPLRAASVSGAVTIAAGQGEAPVSIETVSGDIDVRLPDPFAAVIRLEPGRNLVDLRGGLLTSAGGGIEVGAGRWPLRLATVSGRLTVRRAGTVLLVSVRPMD